MRMNLPGCDFKNCRFFSDGNCSSKEKYSNCDYQWKKQINVRDVVYMLPPSCNVMLIDSDTKKPLEGETAEHLTADYLECFVKEINATNLSIQVKVEKTALNNLND